MAMSMAQADISTDCLRAAQAAFFSSLVKHTHCFSSCFSVCFPALLRSLLHIHEPH